MQQRVLGTTDESERTVDADRPQVAAVDVQEGRLPRAQNAIHHASNQRPRITTTLRVGMRAHGADLAEVANPKPLACHRDKPPGLANTEVASQLDRARPERPGPGE